MRARLKSLHLDVAANQFSLGEMSIEADAVALRTVLQELTTRSGGTIQLIDAQSGEFNEEYTVLVNDREFRSLPQGLETNLHDGDEVAVGLTILTGG